MRGAEGGRESHVPGLAGLEPNAHAHALVVRLSKAPEAHHDFHRDACPEPDASGKRPARCFARVVDDGHPRLPGPTGTVAIPPDLQRKPLESGGDPQPVAALGGTERE